MNNNNEFHIELECLNRNKTKQQQKNGVSHQIFGLMKGNKLQKFLTQ